MNDEKVVNKNPGSKKNRVGLTIIVLFVLLCVISKYNEYKQEQYNKLSNIEKLELNKSENDVYIYSKGETELIAFDTKEKEVSPNNELGSFWNQYMYSPNNNRYISECYLDDSFQVIEVVDENKIKVVYESPKNHASDPLATDGERYIFLHHFMKDGESDKMYLAEIIDGKIVDYKNRDGYIGEAAIYDGYLYYSSGFGLYKVSLDDINGKPQKIGNYKDVYDVIVTKDGIWCADEKNFYNLEGEKMLPYAEYTYGFEDSKYVYQMIPDGDDARNGCELVITDITTMKKVKSWQEVVDFKIDGDTVKIYGDFYYEEYKLDK